MAVPLKQLEVERVMNLIRGFGWELLEQKFTNGDIIITVKKTLTPEQLASVSTPSPGPG